MEGKYRRSVETDLVGTSSTFPTVFVPWEVCTTGQYMLLMVVLDLPLYGHCSVRGIVPHAGTIEVVYRMPVQ